MPQLFILVEAGHQLPTKLLDRLVLLCFVKVPEPLLQQLVIIPFLIPLYTHIINHFVFDVLHQLLKRSFKFQWQLTVKFYRYFLSLDNVVDGCLNVTEQIKDVC